MADHRSFIKVVDYSGQPVKNLYVELRFGWTWSGAKTDSNGVATIEHDSTGSADIKINGKTAGYMRVPGSATVKLDPF